MKSPSTIAVGMSGGVDSSVAAALLKSQGHNVIGLFMKNWEEPDETGACAAAADYEDVARVCDQLKIPYYGVNFAREYRENVFASFLQGFSDGLTPNPDVLCNREIKFKVFFEKALELGAALVATGHYCRNPMIDGRAHLCKGVDSGKDQSYFLHAVGHESLAKTLFPVGGLEKNEVRRIARELGLATKDKKDSMGICFIGERRFRQFLRRHLPESAVSRPGEFRRLDGTVVGEHEGAAFYTLGQRKGLRLGGSRGSGGENRRWYVVRKDMARNIVYVERDPKHPALLTNVLVAREASWVGGRAPGPLPFRCAAKTRYRQPDEPCVIHGIENGFVHVGFARAQRAVTPGQFVVFYSGEECLGGALIQGAASPNVFSGT